MNLNKSFELDNGIINDGAVIPESLVGSVRSVKPLYTANNLTQIIYYKSLTQTTVNRIASSVFTYTNNNVNSIVTTYYDTDGATAYSTETTTISYNGNNVSNIEVSVS